MDIDFENFATVVVPEKGGEVEVAQGTVGHILGEFAQGRIGRPGGMSMRLAGRQDLVLGVQLAKLVDEYKNRLES